MHTFGKINSKFVSLTFKCPKTKMNRDVTTGDFHDPLPRPLSPSLFNRERTSIHKLQEIKILEGTVKVYSLQFDGRKS